MAGVGTTWYTWLEQGRDVRASLDVLESLASGLKMTSAERAHLILLGRGEQAPPCKPPAERLSNEVRRLVQNLGPGPAVVVGRRWDVLAWNRAAAVVLGDYGQIPKQTRNQLWLMFTDPARRDLFVHWEKHARIMVAKARADYARHMGDPAFDELVQTLRDSSPCFRRIWERHEVAQTGEGRKHLNHPIAGRMVFDHAAFRALEDPEQRLVIYSPSCQEDTVAKLEALLEDAPEPALALVG